NSGQTLAPVDSGGLTLQAEGALINYRRWEIMEFPASTPAAEHYLHRVILDVPAGGAHPPLNGFTFRWRSIGDFPAVRIEYRLRDSVNGAWNTIADSAPNSGSYFWPAGSGMPLAGGPF